MNGGTRPSRVSSPKKQQQQKARGPSRNLGGRGAFSAPVAQSIRVRTGRPTITSLRNGDCRVVHREYIAEVTSSLTASAFKSVQYTCNAGQATTFPWLSKIAQNFESYTFNKLRFDYETEASSSTGGTVVLALDYDAIDSAPSTKQQALAYRGSVRSAPWTPCQHISLSEDLRKLPNYYVRPGPQPANSDLKTYDVGNLFVVTQGITATGSVLGELYVEYDVHLKTPVFEPILPNGSLIQPAGAGVLTTALLGTQASVVSSGSIVMSSSLAGNTLTLTGLQVGSEIVVSYSVEAAVVAGKLTMAATTGLTLGTSVNPTWAADTMGASVQTFTVTANVATITLAISGGTLTTPSLVAVTVNSFYPVLVGF